VEQSTQDTTLRLFDNHDVESRGLG
jgi:hypothetical protein